MSQSIACEVGATHNMLLVATNGVAHVAIEKSPFGSAGNPGTCIATLVAGTCRIAAAGLASWAHINVTAARNFIDVCIVGFLLADGDNALSVRESTVSSKSNRNSLGLRNKLRASDAASILILY